MPPLEQARFLDAACGTDSALRAEVEALLRADLAATPAVLQQPLVAGLSALGATHRALQQSLRVGVEPAAPQTIGPFRVLHRLGAGGMGVVYAAEQHHPRRIVAIKTIRPELVSAELLRRFERETQLLAGLQHPGIARLYDAGQYQPPQGPAIPYYAMELVDGRRLDDFAREQALSPRECVGLMVQVCEAVQHAHSRGIVHRDLKPANLFVTAAPQRRESDADSGPRAGRTRIFDWSIKVLDFGIARLCEPSASDTALPTAAGNLIGTLTYMSPEQLRGAGTSLDVRSDVYSLGVILYELLSGRPPLAVPADLGLLAAAREIAEHEPTRLRYHNPRFRGDIESIVAKALEKSPARRYADAGALGADLLRFLDHEPVRARPAGTFYQLQKFAQRHRGLVAGVGLAASALLIGLIASLFLYVRADRERRRADVNAGLAAQRAREAECGERAARRFSYRAALAAAQAAMQSEDVRAMRDALRSAPPELRGFEWRYLDHVANRYQYILPCPPRFEYVAVSANARFAALKYPDQSIAVWNLDRRELWKTISTPAPVIRLAIDPDGEIVACSDLAESWAIDVDVDEVLWRRAATFLGSAQPFDPIDRTVTLVDSKGDSVYLVDARSGDDRRRVRLHQHAAAFASYFAQTGAILASGYGTVALDAETGAELCWQEGHSDECGSASLSAVRVSRAEWRIDLAERCGETRRLEAGGDIPSSFVWNRSRGIAASIAGGAIRLSEVATNTTYARLFSHAATGQLAMADDGGRLISVSGDGNLAVWDTTLSAAPLVLPRNRDDIGYGAAFDEAGDCVASCGWGCVSLWNAQTTALQWRARPSRQFFRAAAFDSSGSRLAVAGSGNQVFVLNASTGATIGSHALPDVALVFALAWLPEQEALLAACDTGELFIVDLRKPAAPLGRGNGPATCVVVSRDGRWAASGAGNNSPGGDFGSPALPGNDDAVSLWPLDGRHATPRVLGFHRDAVVCLAFNADATRLLSGGRDTQVLMWDLVNGGPPREFPGCEGEVFGVAMSGDGTRVAALSEGSVRIWDAEDTTLLAALPLAGAGPNSALRFAAQDESILLSTRGAALVRFDTVVGADIAPARHVAYRAALLRASLESQHRYSEDMVAAIEADRWLPADVALEAVRQERAAGDFTNRVISDAIVIATNARRPADENAEALRGMQSAMRLLPEEWRLIGIRGMLHYRTGQFEPALSDLAAAHELYARHQVEFPVHLAAFHVMALAATRRRDEALRAMSELDRKIAAAPATTDARDAALVAEARASVPADR